MSKQLWFTSDSHFGHRGVTQFLRANGTKLRPWDNVEEMDEALVKNWNSVVREQDTIYHLGDVAINRKALPILGRLNGRKVLVKGNHDIFRLEEYTKYFEDIRAYRVFDTFIASHIPLHRDQMDRFCTNVHGHLHSNVVMKDGIPDPRYLCVCVEQTDFTPISKEEVERRILAQGGTFRNVQGNK